MCRNLGLMLKLLCHISNVSYLEMVVILKSFGKQQDNIGLKERPSNPTFVVDEIHANARFDIIQNKGFWTNGKVEQEIDANDWFNNPKKEGYFYQPKQPHNPNNLAIIIGYAGRPYTGIYDTVHIRTSVLNYSYKFYEFFSSATFF